MLDLLAAIVSVDPPSLLGWVVLAFAAGMYPVGIMLGASCSPCCSSLPPCADCDGNDLPETVTVTVNGFPAQRVQGGPLAFLNFESDFGFGASGKVTAPGGDNPGPISAVELSEGGEGYARLVSNRLPPTVTASAGGTQQFTVSLENVGEGEEAVWVVSGLALDGEGTTESDDITFAVQGGGVVVEHAAGRLVRARAAPSITLSVNSAGGGGAELVAVLYQGFSRCDGSPVWAFNDIAINNAGGGYAVGDQVVFTLNNGTALHCGFRTDVPFVVKTVGSNGAIVDFELDTNDKDIIDWYFAEYVGPANGPIEAVILDAPGAYYLPGPTTVEVAKVTVTVNQRGVAGASGAVITPTINTNPQSTTFGQIVSLSITNGGTGYLAWKWVEICCAPYWNGKTVVLKRPARSGLFGPIKPCLYSHSFTNKACTATVEVEYSQSSVRVMVNDPAGFTPTGENTFISAGCFAQGFATPKQGESCVQFPFGVTTAQGITFSVSAGGNYVPNDPGTPGFTKHVCCRNGGIAPAEIEAKLYFPEGYAAKEAWGIEDPEATYVTLMLSRGLMGGPSGATFGCTISYGILAPESVYAGVTRCDDYLLPNCQSCARNCQTVVGMPGGDYINFPITHWFSRQCENCTSDTMCKPLSGSYLINMRDPRYPYADPQPGPETSFFRLEIQ